MIKSKELAGPSCLTNAAYDEPIFVLKSTDELAPTLVRDWAERYRDQKGGFYGMTDKQAEKYWEAVPSSDGAVNIEQHCDGFDMELLITAVTLPTVSATQGEKHE